jgi:V/A-type H+-transporting ATPase subunit E
METTAQQGAAAGSLQGLLDRIRKEGVDKAQAEARGIVEAARKTAGDIVRKAEQDAQVLRDDAGRDAERAREQGRQALEQAARDILIAVGNAVQETLDRLVRADVTQALKGPALQALVTRVVEGYTARLPAGAAIEVLVPEPEREALAAALAARLTEAAQGGLDVRADRSVVAGFRVSARNGGAEHDFTAAAIADAICRLVRPQLAERVRAAAAAGKAR